MKKRTYRKKEHRWTLPAAAIVGRWCLFGHRVFDASRHGGWRVGSRGGFGLARLYGVWPGLAGRKKMNLNKKIVVKTHKKKGKKYLGR